jgi:acyl-coenzyme A thioesterase PaaI-like protein
MAEKSLQETYAPNNKCFGCGPANAKGLRIRSFAEGDRVVLQWQPQPHHEAFGGVVNGGIIGTLFDCHSNWTAAWHLMQRDKLEELPSTVTADFHVTLKRPTPSTGPVQVVARAVASDGDRVTVEAEMSGDGKVTATCRGTFVAVRPGHPAYHRW